MIDWSSLDKNKFFHINQYIKNRVISENFTEQEANFFIKSIELIEFLCVNLQLSTIKTREVSIDFICFCLIPHGIEPSKFLFKWFDRNFDADSFKKYFKHGCLTYESLKSIFIDSQLDYIAYIKSLVLEGYIENRCGNCSNKLDINHIANFNDNKITCIDCFYIKNKFIL